ncbi:MAG: CARDB domain-containing protein [Armatimonadota bacterium]
MVESLSFSPEADIAYGQDVLLRGVVRNAGGSTLRSIAVQVLIDDRSVSLFTLDGLPAGESRPVSAVWQAISGVHTLHIVADPYFRLPDANFDNNRASVQLPEIIAPDLEIANLTYSPEAFIAGQRVSMAVEVRNLGPGRINTSVPIEIRVDDNRLTSLQIVPPLAPNSSQTIRFDYTALTGQHRIQAIADPNQQLGEANRANNVHEVALPEVPTPDLVLSDLQLLPDNPQTGQAFAATVRLRNVGGGYAGAAQIRVEQLNAQGTVLGQSDSQLQGVASGLDRQISLNLVRQQDARRLRVTAIAGTEDAQPDNNQIELELPESPRPDFVLTQVQVQTQDSPLFFGSTVRFEAQIRNDGGNFRLPIGYPQGIPVRFLLDGQVIGQALLGGLDAGVSTTVGFNWRVDRPLQNPTLRVVVDADNAVSETSEDNNSLEQTMNATVAPIDLAVQSVSIEPANRPAGDSAGVVVRVQSAGRYVGRLSVRAQVDGQQLPDREQDVSIPDGGSTSITLPWRVTPGGARTVRVQIDPANRISESNEQNNARETSIDYPVDAPDFTFGDLRFEAPEGVRHGDNVLIRLQVVNNGAAYASAVPVRISVGSGFSRTQSVSVPAGGVSEVTVSWPAVVGNNHPLSAVIDPDNAVPESNEDNNTLARVLAIDVAPRPALQLVLLNDPPVPVAPGQVVDLDIEVRNNGQVELYPLLQVTGLPQGWGDLNELNLRLPAGERVSRRLRISVPSNATTQNVTFTVRATASAYNLEDSAQRTLQVIAEPVITGLTPTNNAVVGGSVVVRWFTHVPASSEVRYRSAADADWTVVTGEPGTTHSVTLRNLRPNARYVFVARSVNAYGVSESEQRTFTVAKGIAFEAQQLQFTARRDYDQRFTINLRNNDSQPHQVQVTLVNTYDDAPAGFLGVGSMDEPVVIQPNSSVQLTFACHFQNAQQNSYTWRFVARTVGEPVVITDEAQATVTVRPSQAQLVVDLISEDSQTQIRTYRIRNIGTEPAVDVNVEPDEALTGQVGLEPQVSHAYLAPGQEIVFKAFPLYSAAGVGGLLFENIDQATLVFENSLGRIGWNLLPFDMYIYFNGVEIGSLQNQIPVGVQVFELPPAIFRLSNTRSARLPAGAVRRLTPEESARVRAASRALGSLRIWEGNQPPLRITVNTDCPPNTDLYEVNLGERVLVRRIEATHCTNVPVVNISVATPPGGNIRITKSNFNDAHFMNMSNFQLKLCSRDVIVTVCAQSPEEARQIAEARVQELYKQVPRDLRIEQVNLLKAGLAGFEEVRQPFNIPFQGNIRVRISGSGDLSEALVKVDFDNGDPTVVLKPLAGGVFAHSLTLRNTPRAVTMTPDGEKLGVIRATVTARGCEGTTSQTMEFLVKTADLVVRFTDPPMSETGQFTEPIRIPFKGARTVIIKGEVLDSETLQPTQNARVRLRATLRKTLATTFSSVVNYNEDWRPVSANGKFVFVLLVEEPGELEGVVEAQLASYIAAPGYEPPISQKAFSALAVTTIRYTVEADGYRQIEPDDAVEVDLRPGLKEISGTVFAWQIGSDNRLERRPLPNARIVIENGGELSTNSEGQYRLQIDRNGSTEETHNFELLPEDLEVTIQPLPENMLARSGFEGKIGVAVGRDLRLRYRSQSGTLGVETGTLVRGREFDVSVTLGSVGQAVQSDPNLYDYFPPSTLSQDQWVTVTAVDREIPELRATRQFRLHKDGFLRFSKIGFKEATQEVPLVTDNGASELPGLIFGELRERFSGDLLPIHQVEVVSVGVGDENAQTNPDYTFQGELAFPLYQDESHNRSVDIGTVTLGVDQVIADLYNAITPLNVFYRLGFGLPDGFPMFPFLQYLRDWNQRTEADKQKLRDLLSAASRIEMAIPFLKEARDARQQYGETAVKAVVDILLFFASELKLFEKATDSFTVAQGWKLNTKLADGALDSSIRAVGLQDVFAAHPELRDQITEVLRRGMSDGNLVVARDTLGMYVTDPRKLDDFVNALKGERGKIQSAIEAALSAVKGELIGFLRSMNARFTGNTPFEAENELINQVIGAVFGALDGLAAQLYESSAGISPSFIYDTVVSGVVLPYSTAHSALDIATATGAVKQVNDTIRGGQTLAGDDASVRSRIRELRNIVQNDLQWYNGLAEPFGAIADWLNNAFLSTRDVVLGEIPWWKHILQDLTGLLGGVADGLLPIGKAAQVVTINILPGRISAANEAIWNYNLQGRPEREDLIMALSPDFYGRVAAWLRGSLGRGVYGARSRQVSDFETAARRLAQLMTRDQVSPDELLQAVNQLATASHAVNERIRARTAVLNNTWLDGAMQDENFSQIAGAASGMADRGMARRMQLLAAAGGFIEANDPAEAQQAVQTYQNLLEDAIALTAQSEAQVEQALTRLQELNVRIPAVLYVTGEAVPQPDGTQQVQVAVRNEGGSPSAQANVQVQVSGGFELVSAGTSIIPPLVPGQQFTFTLTVRPVSQRGSIGMVVLDIRNENLQTSGYIPLSGADTIAPLVVVRAPAPNERTRAARPLIVVGVGDNAGINPNSVQMQLDGATVPAQYNPALGTITYQPANDLTVGEHRVLVSISDLSGNVGTADWRFTVDPNASAQIKDMLVAPAPFSPNGDGVDDTLNIRFRLTSEARTEVQIVNAEGQVVRTLHALDTLQPVAHSLQWDGKDDGGQDAPAGVYTVRVHIPAEGNQSEQTAESRVQLVRGDLTITNVTLTADRFKIGRESVTLRFNVSKRADVVVNVFAGSDTSDTGAIVRRFELGARSGATSVTWNGAGDTRQFAAKGVYTFQITARTELDQTVLDGAAQVTAIGLPDLSPVQLTATEENGQTRLDVQVRNTGEEPAQNVLVRLLYGSQNIGEATIAALDAGQQQTVSVLWDAHRGLLTRDLSVIVDPDDTVEEINEYDNTLLQSVEVAPLRLVNTFPAGLSLISLPLTPLDANPSVLLGIDPAQLRIAWWDPVAATYVTGNDITALEPGRAYWVRLSTPVERQIAGVRAPASIRLKPGWNLFGVTGGAVTWDLQAIRVRRNDQTLTLAQAQEAGWLDDYAWGWQQDASDPNTGSYVLIYDASLIPGVRNTIEPWKGYWIRANVECELLLP